MLVVGDKHLDRIHAAMVVRQDPRLESLPPRASAAWSRLTGQIRQWRGEVAVLSYELFAGASTEQVATALADLDGLEVHVVITARDLARSVPSAWQERLKFALTTPLERWKPRPESAGARAEWGWRTMDPAGVAARWGAGLPPERVHIVTVPRDGGDGQQLWHRFAAACGIDVPGLPALRGTRQRVAGPGLRRTAAPCQRAVREPITGNREQAMWLRDTLAHGVLVDLGREPIGLTDEQFAEASGARGRDRGAHRRRVRRARRRRGAVAPRLDARTPGEVGDGELLDAAVRAIVRAAPAGARAHRRPPSRAPGRRAGPGARRDEGSPGRAGKGVARAATGKAVPAENRRLHERLDELEDELRESRKLQLRVAELNDVVTELLLPAAQQDPEVTAAALERYRSESL